MSCLLTQRVYVVSSQLVCGRVGGVQPDLWRRGADATGPVCPENQPDQWSRPGRLSLYPAHPGKEASLQHTQLSTGLDHWAMVRGMFVKMVSHHQGRDLCLHRYKSVQQLLLCTAGKKYCFAHLPLSLKWPEHHILWQWHQGLYTMKCSHGDLPCLGLWPVPIHCVGWLLNLFKTHLSNSPLYTSSLLPVSASVAQHSASQPCVWCAYEFRMSIGGIVGYLKGSIH